MGENTTTHIMKVSAAGTSLKESEKKVYDKTRRKMAGVFSKQRFGFAGETTTEELKIFPKTQTQ